MIGCGAVVHPTSSQAIHISNAAFERRETRPAAGIVTDDFLLSYELIAVQKAHRNFQLLTSLRITGNNRPVKMH